MSLSAGDFNIFLPDAEHDSIPEKRLVSHCKYKKVCVKYFFSNNPENNYSSLGVCKIG